MFLVSHRPVEHPSQQPGQNEVDDGNDDEREESIESTASDEVGCLGEVHDGNIADDGCALEEGHSLTFIYWHDVANGLGRNDVDEGLQGCESQGDTGLGLSFPNGENGGAEHFADVGSKNHRETDYSHSSGIESALGQHYVEHNHENDQLRNASHEIDISDGKRTQEAVTPHTYPAEQGCHDGAKDEREEGDDNGLPKTLGDEVPTVFEYQVAIDRLLDVVNEAKIL